MDFMFACVTLIVTIAAMALMLYAMWKDTLKDVAKDAKIKNTIYATKIAERKYKEMLQHTEYRIRRNPVRFINESDIDWGDEKEVLM